MKSDSKKAEFVERFGRFWEKSTGSRVGGQILGYLMTSEPPHVSSAELVAALKISAGSVSMQLRHLESIGFLERRTFPGNRTTYFELKEDAWIGIMDAEATAIESMLELARAGEELEISERPDRVTSLYEVASFFHREWPALLAKLKSEVDRKAK